MTKLFLVKGDERHEVEMIDGRYNFCAQTDHSVTPLFATYLGYELQEVEREECWVVVDGKYDNSHAFEKRGHAVKHAKDYGGIIKHMVALEDDERIISREDVERAYSRCGYETKGNIVLNKLCKELGFGEDTQ